MSVYKASRQYGVPESTLRDCTRGNVSLDANPGPDRLFSYEEEKELVEHLKYTASIGYGYTKSNVQYLASEFAVACKKEICLKHPLVKDIFMPQCIYYIDETGLSLEHSPPKIISAKDTKPQACTSSRSSNITIIGGAKRWNDSFLDGTPAGSSGKCSESGWSNSSVFYNYMTRHFVKYVTVSKDEPLLVLYDGTKEQYNFVRFTTAHFTPYTTIRCWVFGPLKSVYNHECQQFLRKNPGKQITKYEVWQLSGKAYTKSMTPENLASAFRKAGVYPCDKSVITPVDFVPSQIYSKDPQCTTGDSLPANTSVTPGQDNLQNLTSAKIANSCTTSSVTDSNNNSFFEVHKINAVRNRPARKFVPPYLCGNLSKQKNVTMLENTAKRQEKKTQVIEKANSIKIKSTTCKPNPRKRKQGSTENTKFKFSKQKSIIEEENVVPSTSGLGRKEGPIPVDKKSEFSESDSESSDSEEKCCVCDKFTPAEVRKCTSIIFTKWARCDFCPHWTHLSFCCDTTVIR
ncbi:hypothetical protein KUTeg_003223 [Tegillarca granosa]|uniref:HTH psq-type domain-containing protein n=1 Tax=Tegillarca granosa TaxID=220873 RepID=A0ABQ9FQD1_TEGGR|nr:hypothetical protein KUTeg_003223 [Tegillarca granosa]